MGAQERVDIKVTADNAAALSALQAIAASLEKIGVGGQKAGGDVAGGLEKGAISAGKMALAMVGVGSAMQAVSTAINLTNKSWDDLIERQRKAADSQISFADAQRRAAFMLDPGTLADATKEMQRIQAETGVPSGALFGAIGAAASARGPDFEQSQALKYVGIAARMLPGPSTQQDEIRSIVSAGLEMNKGFPGTTPEQAMGALLSIAPALRQEEMPTLAQNAVAPISAQRAFGGDADTFKFLGSIMAAVGQRSGDVSGRRTATNLTNFYKQIRVKTAMLPKNTTMEARMNFLMNTEAGTAIRKQMLGPLFAGGDIEAGAERGDEAMMQAAEQIFGADARVGLKSEAKTFVGLMELLQSGDNKTKRMVKAAQGMILEPTDPKAGDVLRGRLAEIEAQPIQRAARLDRQLGAVAEGMKQAHLPGGTTAAVRKQLEEVLSASGADWLSRRGNMFAFDVETLFGMSPQESAIEQIRGNINRFQEFVPAGGANVRRQTIAGNGDAVARLERAIALLGEDIKASRNVEIKAGGEAFKAESKANTAGDLPGRRAFIEGR